MSQSFALPLHHCPACEAELDAVSRMGGSPEPTAGGVSICVYCGTLNSIGADLTVRRATPEELRRFLSDPAVVYVWGSVVSLILNRAFGERA